MRKLTTLLLLFGIAHAQMTSVVIGPYPGHGRTANEINATNQLRIPLMYYLSDSAKMKLANPAMPYKPIMVDIDIHGCGEKSISFANYAAITTGDLPRLFNNGMPQYLRYSTSAYVNKKYAAIGKTDSFDVMYIFPQAFGGVTSSPCAGNTGLGVFSSAYGYDILLWLKANFKGLIDTNRIYITGLSFGAGGIWNWLQDSTVNRQVAGAIASAPGYIDLRNISGGNTAQGVGSNWPALDNWPGFILAVHSTDDTQTDKQPGTSIGSWYTDVAVDSLLKRKSAATVWYVRRNSGDHGGSWNSWQNPIYSSTSITTTNGNLVTFKASWQSVLLTYTRQLKSK